MADVTHVEFIMLRYSFLIRDSGSVNDFTLLQVDDIENLKPIVENYVNLTLIPTNFIEVTGNLIGQV